jgi:hypothetical protein
MGNWRQLRCAAHSVALGTALLATAACQGSQANSLNQARPPAQTESPRGSVPSATEASTAAVPSEETAILAQYRKFFALQTPLIEAPAAQRPSIFADVAVDPAYTSILESIAQVDEAGETFYGELELNPVVLSVDDATAEIRDCQDASMRGRMKRVSGAKVTVGRAGDELLATMLRGEDGVWRVSHAVYQAGQC